MTTAKTLAARAAALGLAVLMTQRGVRAPSLNCVRQARTARRTVGSAGAAGRQEPRDPAGRSQKRASNQAASDIARLGGQIQFRDDALGYLRVSVPVGQVKAVAALASVQSVDVDELVPLPDPRPEGAAATVPQPPPTAATPRINPYLPIGDTGAAQFTPANPTWDGRGVTIGVVDLGITLDHPSLLSHLHRRKKGRGLGDGDRSVHG